MTINLRTNLENLYDSVSISVNGPSYNSLAIISFYFSGTILEGLGKVLRECLDDIWGDFFEIFGRFLKGF